MSQYRYPGGIPFTENDENIFYGRENDVQNIQQLLKLKKMLILYAESGIGKSSLINAKLIPTYRKQSDEEKFAAISIRFFAKCEQGEDHDDVLKKKLYDGLDAYIKELKLDELTFDKYKPKNDLWHRVKRFEKSGIKLLLIFDQAEELFTYSSNQIQAFKEDIYSICTTSIPNELHEAIGEKLKEDSTTALKEEELSELNREIEFLYESTVVKLLFSIREDKLGAFSVLADYFPDILKDTYKLKPLNCDQATDAIVKPALATGSFLSPVFSYKSGAVEALLKILKDKKKDTYDPFSIQLNCSYIERTVVIQDQKEILEKGDLPTVGIAEQNFVNDALNSIPKKDKTQCEKVITEKLIDQKSNRRVRASLGEIDPQLVHILLNKGIVREYKDAENTYHELSHDRFLAPILENYKDYQNKKKRLKWVMSITGSLGLIFIVAIGFISWSYETKKDTNQQWSLFYKASEYLTNGNLKQAFGILGMLRGKNDYLKKKIKQVHLEYSDLPGNPVLPLSNNHILCIINDSTFEIWSIESNKKINLEKTYTHVQKSLTSTTCEFLALVADEKLILYNSKTNKDTALIQINTTKIDFNFSENSAFFFFYSNGYLHIIGTDNTNRNYTYLMTEDDYESNKYNVLLYATEHSIFLYNTLNASIDEWVYRDNKFLKDFQQKIKSLWTQTGEDSIIFGGNREGLKLLKLSTKEIVIINPTIRFDAMKIKNNRLFIYSRDKKERQNVYLYKNLSLINLKTHRTFIPFKDSLCEKIAVTFNYTKYLVKGPSKEVYLIDFDEKHSRKIPLPFLKSAIAYDISNDGNHILYVIPKGDNGLLYLSHLEKNPSSYFNAGELIGPISSDKKQRVDDSTDIYNKYFFRFSSDSKMFAYINETKDSSSFIVCKTKDKMTTFKSGAAWTLFEFDPYYSFLYPQYIPPQLDFTGDYIHTTNNTDNIKTRSRKEGIFLLNTDTRNIDYYLKIYPPFSKAEITKLENEIKSNDL